MAYNPIQFQQGMSLPEFLQSFGTEAGCAEAVRRARWLGGFVCQRCDSDAHCIVVSGSRRLYQCHACHRQTSLTAGSLFGSTKLPLTLPLFSGVLSHLVTRLCRAGPCVSSAQTSSG